MGKDKMRKVQIQITRIYPRGKKGPSKSMTVEGVSLTQAYNRIKELFK